MWECRDARIRVCACVCKCEGTLNQERAFERMEGMSSGRRAGRGTYRRRDSWAKADSRDGPGGLSVVQCGSSRGRGRSEVGVNLGGGAGGRGRPLQVSQEDGTYSDWFFLYPLKDMVIDFKQRGREGEKHRCEKEILVHCLSHAVLMGDQTHKPGVCPD